MDITKTYQFSGPVTVFQDRWLPETGAPAGYAALIESFGLAVPLPRTLFATGTRHKVVSAAGWHVLTPRHAPEASLEGHLTFALKYEGLNLLILKKLFESTGPEPLQGIVKGTPTGSYARRLWFLYEWLLDEPLDLPDAGKGAYVLVIDPKQQLAGTPETSPRHRVKNNLPGTPAFCPLVDRSEALDTFIGKDLAARALEVVADVPRDILARTATFLLLKDSKSSYAIEGEHPPQDRIQRWGRAIGEAGKRPLDLDELLRLQSLVIGDARFVTLGVRTEGGFVGEHDRDYRTPLPDHISARPEDLDALLGGLIAFDHGPAQAMDAVIAAAVLAFGFVYIHPFEDGNGRIHRYLIHHALAERGFNPPGVVFPVSAAILEDINSYSAVLESISQPLLPFIEWEATENANVRVLNDTADYYRYFDATAHAEFLYKCVAKTIEEDLPGETAFLRRYDQFRGQLQSLVDMPDRTADLLFRFLEQNSGILSTRARDKEFSALTDEETQQIEAMYRHAFDEDAPPE